MAKRAFKKVYIRKHYLLLAANDLLIFCNGLAAALTGSSLVTTPIISLILFGTRITVLSDLLTNRVTDQSEDLTQEQINAETVLYDTVDALADQVEFLANDATPGDVATITGAIVGFGFKVKDPSLRQDQTFKVIKKAHEEATITHPLPENKKQKAIYIVAYTTTPSDADSWSQPVMTVESKVTLQGLEADKRGYFRRAIILAQGLNPVVNINDIQIDWHPDIISELIP